MGKIGKDEVRAKLKEHSWNQPQVTECSHLLVFCAPTNVSDDHVHTYLELIAKERGVHKESLESYGQMMFGFLKGHNHETLLTWIKHQLYIALGQTMKVCAHLRVDSCPIEGFDSDKYDEILNLKEKHLTSVVLLPIGYRSENDKYQHAKKVRYPLGDVVEFVR